MNHEVQLINLKPKNLIENIENGYKILDSICNSK